MTALKAVLLAATLLLSLGGITAAAEVDLDRWQRLSTRGVEQANAGRLEEAEESLRAAYMLASGLRETDPRRATTANNLGFVLHAGGRPEAAIPLYEEAMRLREAALGPEHPAVARASTTWPRPCGHSARPPKRCPCTAGHWRSGARAWVPATPRRRRA